MLWLSVLLACESTPSSGALFEPARVSAPPAASPPAAADPRFEPEKEPFRISSEELAAGGALASPDTVLASNDALPPESASVSLPAFAPFPVRLLSTLPHAQPPRAVLGLPDGTEVVVSPGTVLGHEALVVLAVMPGRIQLAQVRPAGDHAVIESLELSAQYP